MQVKKNKDIECVVTAQAKYIISGDKHLLNLEMFRNTRIISSLDFLNI